MGGHGRRLLPGPQATTLGVLHRLLEQVATSVRGATAEAARWLGHRVWVVDGSSFSMPDAPALQAAFGQPAGLEIGEQMGRTSAGMIGPAR